MNDIRIHRNGRVTLSADQAHCVLRLLAVADDDTRVALGLSPAESAVADDVYAELAARGVGGHFDGLTPQCCPAAA